MTQTADKGIRLLPTLQRKPAVSLSRRADELMQGLEAEEDAMGYIGLAECLVDIGKTSVSVMQGTVDDTDAISEDLASEVQQKARILIISLEEKGESVGIALHNEFGQVGFLRQDPTQTSPGGTQHYNVVPCTAKHNLRNVKKADGKLFSPYEIAVAVDKSTKYRLSFADKGDEDEFNDEKSFDLRKHVDGATSATPSKWQWGFDISKGDHVDRQTVGVSSEANSFAVVRSTFQLEVNQKVGIAVSFSEDCKPNEITIRGSGGKVKGVDNIKIAEIYGAPDYAHVYTGRITHVGPNHIEYTINSFTSCSGAIVFLLDQKQPISVQQCDFGKAIAVHTGAHPSLVNRNFAFRLLKEESN